MPPRTATIVILTEPLLGLDPNSTIARVAASFWVPQGHRVIVHRGIDDAPAGDIAIVHVDLTSVDPAYRALAARYPVAINGDVADVGKRAISRDLVTTDDPYDGPVIVKTDLNHAGIPERHRRLAASGRWLSLWEDAAARLPASWTGRLPGDEYLVFANKGAVPRWVWRTPMLVVQRLYVERRGDLYAMHQWYCLGDSDCVSTFLAASPIVKLATVVERLPLHREVPEAMRRRRSALRIDYGKIDFILDDGVPALLDANRTPNEGAVTTTGRIAGICAAVAAGLDLYLARI